MTRRKLSVSFTVAYGRLKVHVSRLLDSRCKQQQQSTVDLRCNSTPLTKSTVLELLRYNLGLSDFTKCLAALCNYRLALSNTPFKSRAGSSLSTTPSTVDGFLYPSSKSIFSLIVSTFLLGTARNWFSSVRRLPRQKKRPWTRRTSSFVELWPPP